MVVIVTYGGHGTYPPTVAVVIGVAFLAYPFIAWLVTKRRWADDAVTIVCFLFGTGFIISAIVFWTRH